MSSINNTRGNSREISKEIYHPPNRRNSEKKHIYKHGEISFVDLAKNSREFTPFQKTRHIEKILNRAAEVRRNNEHQSDYLKLIYQIRDYCIVSGYFPEGSKYLELFENYDEHPGWQDKMGSNERDILFSFKKVAEAIREDPENTILFKEVDKKFGEYRRLRWVEKEQSKK